MGGNRAADLLEFSASTFRENLSRLTGFSGRFMDIEFHAHHLIPKQFFARFRRLGVDIHNPIFGQWLQDTAHIALHQNGTYNAMFGSFINKLETSGMRGNEAVQATMEFIANEIMPKFKQLGLEPPF